ncbi:CPCC family cysteine-rich protein [Streptomyces sp. NPDC003444]
MPEHDRIRLIHRNQIPQPADAGKDRRIGDELSARHLTSAVVTSGCDHAMSAGTGICHLVTSEDSAPAPQWFNIVLGPENGPYACPCCGYLTLEARGAHEICTVCYWEDDGQDEHDDDVVRGGPNQSLSLVQAQRNFEEMGACDPRWVKYVRAPFPEEQ